MIFIKLTYIDDRDAAFPFYIRTDEIVGFCRAGRRTQVLIKSLEKRLVVEETPEEIMKIMGLV